VSFAVAELILAGALWGFGFIAARWALQSMGPLWATSLRFVLASALGLLLCLLISPFRKSLTKRQVQLAVIPGLLLTLTLVLQTWGLKYTTATKSGFITTLYVLLVPIIEWAWLKRRLSPLHALYVTMAIVGTAMICELHAEALNFGDFLTLLCAVAASFQIFWFVLISKRIESAMTFNVLQTIWAIPLPLTLALLLEPFPSHPWSAESWSGLLSLAFGSTLIAFALQVRAQKFISPSVASLLFLLESPFAALFAVWLLGESLNLTQALGGGLILLAAALSVVSESKAHANDLPHASD
jgi:drug/metabolite transporter (DMT)-like permease